MPPVPPPPTCAVILDPTALIHHSHERACTHHGEAELRVHGLQLVPGHPLSGLESSITCLTVMPWRWYESSALTSCRFSTARNSDPPGVTVV